MNQKAPDTDSSDTLILDCTAFRTIRNKFVVYKAPGLWYSVPAASTAASLENDSEMIGTSTSLRDYTDKLL